MNYIYVNICKSVYKYYYYFLHVFKILLFLQV